MNYTLLGAGEQISERYGVKCRQRAGVYNATEMAGIGAAANDPNANLPYCDMVPAPLQITASDNFLDSITNWIKANPLLAGAIALGAFFVIKK